MAIRVIHTTSVVSEGALLNRPRVIPCDTTYPLRGYRIRVGKGTQSSHRHSRKDDTSQYNFLSLEHHLRVGGGQFTGRGGAEFDGWNVRKSGEIVMGLLQPDDMSGSGTKRKQMHAVESVV